MEECEITRRGKKVLVKRVNFRDLIVFFYSDLFNIDSSKTLSLLSDKLRFISEEKSAEVFG